MRLRPRTTLLLATALIAPACRENSPRPSAQSPATTNANASANAAPGAGANREPAEVPALGADVARELNAAFNREHLDATLVDNAVRVEGHTLAAHAGVAGVIEESDHTTAAIDVRFTLDGAPSPALHVTSIGIDANRPEAIAHAVREWAVGVAMPAVDALRYAWLGTEPAAPDSGATQFTLGTYRAFPGPTGVRGDVPADWLTGTPEMHNGLLDRIAPALQELVPASEPAALHSLKLVLHVQNGTVGDGDCRVDAAPSPRLCDLVRQFPWPSSVDGYVFRQFYLLVPARH